MMLITKIVNQLLAPFNIAVTRRTNLNALEKDSCELVHARQSIETDRHIAELSRAIAELYHMMSELHGQQGMFSARQEELVDRQGTIERRQDALLGSQSVLMDRQGTLEGRQTELLEKQSIMHNNLQSQCEQLQIQVEETKKNLVEESMFERWALMDRLEEISPYPKRERCPLCGAILPDELSVYEIGCIFGGGNLVRYQCPSCDVIFGPEKMFHLSDATLGSEYRWHYLFTNETDCTHLEKQTFYEMEPKCGGVYLNYGSGRWARSIPELRAEGWDVYGYEPFAGGDDGFIIRNAEVLSQMRFDGIFSHDLLEHLKDPAKELRYMASLLKPGGQMNHATACFEYRYAYTRFHLYFFLGRSREVLARNAGLEIRRFIEDGEHLACQYIVPESPLSAASDTVNILADE